MNKWKRLGYAAYLPVGCYKAVTCSMSDTIRNDGIPSLTPTISTAQSLSTPI